MKSIDITFATDGTATIEAHGFKGKDCLKATGPYEKALIGDGKVFTPKPEMKEGTVTRAATVKN